MSTEDSNPQIGETIRMLGNLLGEVIVDQAGKATFELEEEIRTLSIACRDGMLDSFLDECQTFYPAIMQAVDRMLPTYPRHAGRRVSELEHVERLASDHGLDAGMTRHATKRIGGMSQMDWQEAEYTTKEVILSVARAKGAES